MGAYQTLTMKSIVVASTHERWKKVLMEDASDILQTVIVSFGCMTPEMNANTILLRGMS